MKLELFQTKLKVIKTRYNHNMEPLIKLGKCFIGLDAVIPKGEYRGRWGKITQVVIDANGDVCGIIMPYRMVGDTNDLILDNRPDARTYWRLYEVNKIREPKEYKNNRERY